MSQVSGFTNLSLASVVSDRKALASESETAAEKLYNSLMAQLKTTPSKLAEVDSKIKAYPSTVAGMKAQAEATDLLLANMQSSLREGSVGKTGKNIDVATFGGGMQ